MFIEIDKLNKKEKILKRYDSCENCSIYEEFIVGNAFDLNDISNTKKRKQRIKERCEDCNNCNHNLSCKTKLIFEGDIGNYFLEIISLDFKKIQKNIADFLSANSTVKILNTKYKDYEIKFSKSLISRDIGEVVTEYLHSIHELFKLECNITICDSISIEKIIKEILQPFQELKTIIDYWYNHDDFYNEKINRAMEFWGIRTKLEPKIFKDGLYFDENIIANSNYKKRCSGDIIGALKAESKALDNLGSIVYYFPYYLSDVFGLFMEYVVDKGYKIKKCENCKKYFVLYGRCDTKYCSRNSPQNTNKTCSEYSRYQKQLSRERGNICNKAYKSLYNTLRNKFYFCIEGDKEYQHYVNLMKELKIENQIYKKELLNNQISEKDYLKWISDFRERIRN